MLSPSVTSGFSFFGWLVLCLTGYSSFFSSFLLYPLVTLPPDVTPWYPLPGNLEIFFCVFPRFFFFFWVPPMVLSTMIFDLSTPATSTLFFPSTHPFFPQAAFPPINTGHESPPNSPVGEKTVFSSLNSHRGHASGGSPNRHPPPPPWVSFSPPD